MKKLLNNKENKLKTIIDDFKNDKSINLTHKDKSNVIKAEISGHIRKEKIN